MGVELQPPWKRQLNMLSFCLHLAVRLGPVAIIGRLVGRAPDVIAERGTPASRITSIPNAWRLDLFEVPSAASDGCKQPLIGWMERQYPLPPGCLWRLSRCTAFCTLDAVLGYRLELQRQGRSDIQLLFIGDY